MANNPAEEINMEDVEKTLSGFLSQLKGTAEKAKSVLDIFPSLNTMEKKQVKIGSVTVAVSLLEKGSILIEFPEPKQAKEHFDKKYKSE